MKANTRAVPFYFFWTIALLSNTLTTAQSVSLAWLLSAPTLPTKVLLAMQLSDLVGTLLGISLGSRLVHSLQHPQTLILTSIFEGLSSLILAAAALSHHNTLNTTHAYIIAILSALIPFAAACGAPAWLPLISRWPNTHSETHQLLLDGVQFQIAALVGPFLATLLMTHATNSLQTIAGLNFLTFILVSAALFPLRRNALIQHPSPTNQATGKPRPTRDITLKLIKSPPFWALATSSFATESSRIYLPKLLRQTGHGPSFLSTVLALIAISAIISGFTASRLKVSDHTLAVTALLGLAVGYTSWALTLHSAPLLWLLGAMPIGLSVGIVHAPLTNMLMRQAGNHNRSAGAAASLGARSLAGALGGTIFATLISPLGTLVFILSSILTFASGALLMKPTTRTRKINIQ